MKLLDNIASLSTASEKEQSSDAPGMQSKKRTAKLEWAKMELKTTNADLKIE